MTMQRQTHKICLQKKVAYRLVLKMIHVVVIFIKKEQTHKNFFFFFCEKEETHKNLIHGC